MEKLFDFAIDYKVVEDGKKRKIMENRSKLCISNYAMTYMKDPTKTKEEVIREIVDKYKQKFQSDLTDLLQYEQNINKLNDEKQQIIAKIQQSESEIVGIQEQYKIKKMEYLSLFSNDIPLTNTELLNDLEHTLRWFDLKTNWFKKTFGKHQEKRADITQRFNELKEIQEKLKKIESNKQYDKSKLLNLDSMLQQENSRFKNELHLKKTKYDNFLHKMHEEIVECEYTFEETTIEKVQNVYVPPIYGIDDVKEPVSVIISLTDLTQEQQLRNLLEYTGLPIGNDLNSYSFLRTAKLQGHLEPCVSLMTPFFSPETAKQQIRGLMAFLVKHGIKFKGVVKPFRYSQLDPLVDVSDEHQDIDVSILLQKILRNKATKVYRCTDHILPQEVLEENALYRGQTFMTSAPRSSYATITDRAGALGGVYATTSADYAANYAGCQKQFDDVAGKTVPYECLPSITLGDKKYNVGLFSVYKNNNNILYDNMGLEYDWEGFGHARLSAQYPETQLDADLNPLIKRYFVLGETLILIDENNPDWKPILDFFAPKLDVLYRYERWKNLNVLMARIELLREEYRKNGGVVKTYDFTPEQMQKMGLQIKTQAFKEATGKLKTKSILKNATKNIADGIDQDM